MAADQIRQTNPSGIVIVIELDLVNQKSERRFVADYSDRFNRLGMLVNNVGIMNRMSGRTADGFGYSLTVTTWGILL